MSCKKYRRIPCALAALGIVLLASQARAALVFEQVPEGSGIGYYADGNIGVNAFDQRIADNFTLVGATAITKVQWWGSSENFSSPDILLNVSSFVVSFYTMSGGLPIEPPLYTETIPLANVTATPTGNTSIVGSIEYLFEVTLAAPVAIPNGVEHSLHIGAILNAPFGDAFAWHSADADNVFSGDFNPNDGTWEAAGVDDVSFRLFDGQEGGRCCLPSGDCIIANEADCQAAGGTFAGDNTTCGNGSICRGRCCDTFGGCEVTGPADCTAPNTFGGFGTDCSDPTLCQGRCCTPAGGCSLTGSANCLAPNSFGGPGTSCEHITAYGNPLPPTVAIPETGTAGAALPSVITVSDNFSIQDVDVRVKIQHTYRGDLIICLTGPGGGPTVQLSTGAGCTSGGDCGGQANLNAIYDDEGAPINCASANLANINATPDHVIPGSSLTAFDGLPSAGDWTLNVFDQAGGDSGTLLEWELLLDDGHACTGACCATNGSCSITGQQPCQQGGGTFHGAGSSCSPSPCAANGACCTGATCSQQSLIDCGANGGTFGGVNSNCANAPCFRPCCKQNGVCQLLTLAACNALPFSVAGAPGAPCPGDPCIQVGACCFEDGTCQAPLTNAACTGQGGVRWRGDQGCTPNGCQGRCCSPNGSCTIAFPANCSGGGSVYGGDGTNCNDPLTCQGRCCANDGSCSQTGSGNCNGSFGGVGTSCNAGYDMTQIALDFTNIDGTGTLVAGADNSDDGWSTTAVSIGFTFNFYGNDYTSININNNGIMTFGSTAAFTSYDNEPLPANAAAVPNDAIYPLWDDFNCDRFTYPAAFLRSQTQGAPGSQVFIVQWTSEPQYGSANGVDSNTFEAKLFEGTNRIEFHYQTVTQEFVPDTFPGSIIGIENSTGTSAVQFDSMLTCRAALNGGGTALRFAPSVACVPVVGCNCFGDMNGDTVVNGKDIKGFANCVAAGGAGCPCGDMNHAGGATAADVSIFVNRVITGTCGTP